MITFHNLKGFDQTTFTADLSCKLGNIDVINYEGLESTFMEIQGKHAPIKQKYIAVFKYKNHSSIVKIKEKIKQKQSFSFITNSEGAINDVIRNLNVFIYYFIITLFIVRKLVAIKYKNITYTIISHSLRAK